MDEQAFVGLERAGTWQLSLLVRSQSIDGSPIPTLRYECSRLRDLGDCPSVFQTLCLACDEIREVDRCHVD